MPTPPIRNKKVKKVKKVTNPEAMYRTRTSGEGLRDMITPKQHSKALEAQILGCLDLKFIAPVFDSKGNLCGYWNPKLLRAWLKKMKTFRCLLSDDYATKIPQIEIEGRVNDRVTSRARIPALSGRPLADALRKAGK
jgi:hypothetical protein